MILIDSDILIDLLRRYAPALAWAQPLRKQALVIPGFVVLEVLQGCRNRRALEDVEEFLAGHHILWPEPTKLRKLASRFGAAHLRFGIDAFDALIAETAIGSNLPPHTFNARHFAAYAQLVTIQPYTKAQP